jgi:MFS family permease
LAIPPDPTPDEAGVIGDDMSDDAQGRPLFGRNFVTLLAAQATFGYAFSSFFMLPKFLVTELGASPVEIGLVASSYSTATIAFMPMLGVLVDRFGRRVFMTFGALLMAVLAAAFVFVSEIGPLIYFLRAAQGLAFSMVFVGGSALAVDEAPPERIGQAIGLFGLTMLSMNGVAAASVEAISLRAGWPVAFLTAAAAAALSALLSRLVRETRFAATDDGGGGLARVLRRPSLLRLIFVIAMVGAAMGTVVTFHQPFALGLGIETVSGFFVAYAAAAMFVRAVLGHWIDRAGRQRVAIFSLCVYCVDVAAMAWLGSATGLLVLGVGLGVAHGFAYPSLNSLAVSGVASHERGKVMALFQSGFHLGYASAALGFGFLADQHGYLSVFLGGGACALVGLVVIAAAPVRRATAASSSVGDPGSS